MRKKVDGSLLISIGVLIISCSALFISFRQSKAMDAQTEILIQQTKSSAWPYLSINLTRIFENQGISNYTLSIRNEGTGPAIIEGAKISYQGQAAKNWEDLFRVMQLPDTIPLRIINSGIHNEVISNNESTESITLLSLSFNKSPKLMSWFYQRAADITVEICYRSVFNDYWHITRKGIKTNLEIIEYKKVNQCKIPIEEQFLE